MLDAMDRSTQLDLPPDLQAIVRDAVTSGRYATELDAARAAFTLLEEHGAKFAALKHAVEIGINSPHAPLETDFAEQTKRRGREQLAEHRAKR